jgi:hypothetical protein
VVPILLKIWTRAALPWLGYGLLVGFNGTLKFSLKMILDFKNWFFSGWLKHSNLLTLSNVSYHIALRFQNLMNKVSPVIRRSNAPEFRSPTKFL